MCFLAAYLYQKSVTEIRSPIELTWTAKKVISTGHTLVQKAAISDVLVS